MKKSKLLYILPILFSGILVCGTLSGCALPSDQLPFRTNADSVTNATKFPDSPTDDTSDSSSSDSSDATQISDTAAGSADAAQVSDTAADLLTGAVLIPDQTFDVTLQPLGDVTFISYAPDTEKNPYADAVFVIQKGADAPMLLSPMREGNQRPEETFSSVEAVSFPDIDGDGYEDIIIINSYLSVNGETKGLSRSEARIYMGSSDGTFSLKKELSEDANSALAEKTIASVKGFLGVKEPAASIPWQQAYLNYISSLPDDGDIDKFDLIYLDNDDVPELVAVGNCEATGCAIITCTDNGSTYETWLNRLSFTYLERENLLCNSGGLMGSYYDIVYQIQNHHMTIIAQGDYGDPNGVAQFDTNNDPVYNYAWNGTSVSEDAYLQKLNAVYDTSRALPGYDWNDCYSRSAMLAKLSAELN